MVMGFRMVTSATVPAAVNGNFLNQIDHWIKRHPSEHEVRRHYNTVSDFVGQLAYLCLLLFKILLMGFRLGGFSNYVVKGMVTVNQHGLYFLFARIQCIQRSLSTLCRYRHAGITK
jgi:hypothetical protein